MTSFVYKRAVFDGTNASLKSAVSSAGDRFDMRLLAVCTAAMSVCPQDKTRLMMKMQCHLSLTSMLGSN